ncbi:MAG: siderophore biosynthesis protein IucC, partial [Proteobacteria bacterium]
HPKILLNKGRLGFTAEDFQRYAPEARPRFRLEWLAVKKELAYLSLHPHYDELSLRAESLDEAELARFDAAISTLPGGPAAYHYLPAHPWQLSRVIRLQFGHLIASGELISLGAFGDEYSPQVSLRTVSNVTRPGRADLKLPLSVLNTSAYRGISGRYVPNGPNLSRRFATLLEDDKFLAERGTRVRRELGGISVAQSEYAAVESAPYRYHEQLGAIWREANLEKDERTILTAALSQRDGEGRSLARALMRRSQLPPADWLRAYFQTVVIPLYHLQVKHGIGLVAHGQNIVLRLKNDIPVGIYLKDFQGDLRLAEGAYSMRDATLGSSASHLPRLPAPHLIHDLITGHFVSVLRFFSAALALDPDPVAEEEFYLILAQEIEAYARGKNIPSAQDLLRPEFERVLLNKVRFTIGYADSAERPLPALGKSLANPIYQALKARGAL